MQLKTLRRILPGIEIEDEPYCIGYWLRWAGQDRSKSWNKWTKEGWKQADSEIRAERAAGSIIIGASSHIEDRDEIRAISKRPR